MFSPPQAAQQLQSPPRTSEIIGGETTTRGDFDSVVAVVAGQGLCTGTVVSDRLVLTAGHCLTEVQNADQIRVYAGEQIDADNSVAAADFGVHPEFCRDCDDDIFDYGFVIIERDFVVPGGFLLPITSQEEWDEAVGFGNPVTLVGYGEDPDNPAADSGIGTKRAVETEMSDFSPKGQEFFAGGEGRDSCQGDSGGPAFARLADGAWRLVGITSRGSDPCGDGGFYGVPYPALSWIRERTGVDLCNGACGGENEIDISPPPDPDEGCSVGGGKPRPTGWGLAGLLLLVAFRRRPATRRL